MGQMLSNKMIAFTAAVFVTAFAVLARGDDGASPRANERSYESLPEITPESTILITGAAGFLGSQVAMTLLQLYHPKQLLLVDNFDSPALGSQANAGAAFSPEELHYQIEQSMPERTQSQMALLEYKRQRMFAVLQACLFDDAARPKQRTQCDFFKADIRPTIPEFFDVGEVPLFDTLWDRYDNITHVVHLADSGDLGKDGLPSTVTGFKQDQTNNGLLETILEQVYKETGRRSRRSTDLEPVVPVQLVIASSFEVYEAQNLTNEYRSEDDKITQPMSFTGTSKVLQELLATTYASAYKVPSIALRFWPVYGPWDTPQLSTSVFEWMERALKHDYIADENADSYSSSNLHEWVYISDAVNAVISAMQLKLPPGAHDISPLVFNVGGDGTPESPGELNSVAAPLDIFRIAQNLLKEESEPFKLVAPTEAQKIISDNTKAKRYLGYTPKVSLEEGIKRTLGWHVDRLSPYGSLDVDNEHRSSTNLLKLSAIRSRCTSPLDKECLLGTAVFPCVSECSHKVDVDIAAKKDISMCYPTIYDGVVEQTRRLTQGCDVVMYTVSLGDAVSEIPNAFVASTPNQTTSQSSSNNCRVAFVSAKSKLMYNSEPTTSGGRYSTHGVWTLVPVPDAPSGDNMPNVISLSAQSVLPKLSPSNFFDQDVSYAVYVEPHIIISNLENLILKMKEDPKAAQPMGSERAAGVDSSAPKSTTALMLSQVNWSDAPHHVILDYENVAQQVAVYQSVQIGLQGQLRNVPSLDVSWMVHALNNEEDTRLFRCDMYAELLQWGAFHSSYCHSKSMEFVTGLHDLWSRLIRQWAGAKPWWSEESGGYQGSQSPDVESETTDRENPDKENQPGYVLDDADEYLPSKEIIMGVLSSKSTHQFVRVLPADNGLTIALEKSHAATA